MGPSWGPVNYGPFLTGPFPQGPLNHKAFPMWSLHYPSPWVFTDYVDFPSGACRLWGPQEPKDYKTFIIGLMAMGPMDYRDFIPRTYGLLGLYHGGLWTMVPSSWGLWTIGISSGGLVDYGPASVGPVDYEIFPRGLLTMGLLHGSQWTMALPQRASGLWGLWTIGSPPQGPADRGPWTMYPMYHSAWVFADYGPFLMGSLDYRAFPIGSCGSWDFPYVVYILCYLLTGFCELCGFPHWVPGNIGSSSWGSVGDGAFLTWTCGLCGLLRWPMDYVSFSLVPEDNPTGLDDNIPHLYAQYHGWACGKTSRLT